ncbi:TMEM165/GDT1 family protein [Nocardioides limicola]|uniref:TMEM165/GDT1 family protein n=1 Tax=Nocardioides limicola TaxID=2803368 RepID=UPI00193BA53E|nr:TMEM165/GDT1 family protein [Nocardioides sp. DJM-14]
MVAVPDHLIVVLTFATIFVVELPDKTFIATLVLSTRYRPLLVWIGVGLAFAVQTAIAVAFGTAISFLPAEWVRLGAVALFLTGAVILFRAARGADAAELETEHDFEEKAVKAGPAHGFRAVGMSFLVLFAAEWGDLSQLLTLSLVARYADPVAVFIGAWAALLTVSGLAVLAGRALLKRIRLSLLHRLGAGVCVLLAALTVAELING